MKWNTAAKSFSWKPQVHQAMRPTGARLPHLVVRPLLYNTGWHPFLEVGLRKDLKNSYCHMTGRRSMTLTCGNSCCWERGWSIFLMWLRTSRGLENSAHFFMPTLSEPSLIQTEWSVFITLSNSKWAPSPFSLLGNQECPCAAFLYPGSAVSERAAVGACLALSSLAPYSPAQLQPEIYSWCPKTAKSADAWVINSLLPL